MGDEIELDDYFNELDRVESVVGDTSASECTFNKGYMSRQAVFCCLDCTPESSGILAGFCFACSLSCHRDHKLEEVYTKRNFKCDCGTIPQLLCSLKSDVDNRNAGNVYSQNFKGLYCECSRAYPDSEAPELDEVEMLQCCICEDWLHTTHLGGAVIPEQFEEMACRECLQKYSFLQVYALPSVPHVDVDEVENNVISQKAKSSDTVALSEAIQGFNPSETKSSETCTGSKKKEPDISSDAVNAELKFSHDGKCSPDNSKRLLEKDNSAVASNDQEQNPLKRKRSNECKLYGFSSNIDSKKAIFFDENFRDNICKCLSCMEMYKSSNLNFLTDIEDPLFKYEERSRAKREEEDEQLQSTLENLPHQAKCEVARAIGSLHNTIETLVKKIATEGQGSVGTEEIKEAFKAMASETNVNPSIFDHI